MEEECRKDNKGVYSNMITPGKAAFYGFAGMKPFSFIVPGNPGSSCSNNHICMEFKINQPQVRGENMPDNIPIQTIKCMKDSYSRMSSEAQKLLPVFAPFTGVINLEFLENYVEELNLFPSFQDVTTESLNEAIQEAVNLGLMGLEKSETAIFRLQPDFPLFLSKKMQETFGVEEQEHIRAAFRNHYNDISERINNLFKSGEPGDLKIASTLTGMEYENIRTALEISLERNEITEDLSLTLGNYFDSTGDYEGGFTVAQYILKELEKYPEEILLGETGANLVRTIDTIAMRFLVAKKFEEAEQAYRKALDTWERNTSFSESHKRRTSAHFYRQLGQVAAELSHNEEAGRNYRKALEIQQKFNDRHSQAGTYHDLGNYAFKLADFAESAENYRKALKIYTEFDDRHSQALIYRGLGNVFIETCDFAGAEENYRKELEILIQFDDRLSQAGVHHQLGIVFQKSGKSQEAGASYKKALEIYTELDERYEQIKEYHHLGLLAEESRLYKEAKENFEKALEISKKIGDDPGLSEESHHPGRTAEEICVLKEAIENYHKELELKIIMNGRRSQASTYHQIGHISEMLRQFGEAKIYYQKAGEIYKELDDHHSLSVIYYQMGVICQGFRDFNEAEKNYRNALELCIKLDDLHEQAGILHQLGILCKETGNYEAAEKNYGKALELKIQLNDQDSQARTYTAMGFLYKETGETEKAGKCLDKAVQLLTETNRMEEAEIVRSALDSIGN